MERFRPAGLASVAVSRLVVDGYFNTRDAMLVVDDGVLRLRARFDFADALEDVRLDLGELLLV